MLPLGLIQVEHGGITPLPVWPAGMTPKRQTHTTAHIHANAVTSGLVRRLFASIERKLELPL
jgi:hypothetical protein